MGLGESKFALQMRDIITQMVRKEIDNIRPRYRYGQVQTIDNTNSIATVLYAGEVDSITVKMGSIRPTAVGQIVRIEGSRTERFIADVMSGGGITTFSIGDLKMCAYSTPDVGWLLCDGSSILRATYPSLFAKIGTVYGSVDGTHFNLPDYTSAFPRGNTPGATGGTATHTHAAATHSHALSTNGYAHVTAGSGIVDVLADAGATSWSPGARTVGTSGTGTSHTAAASLGGSTDSTTPGATGSAGTLPPYEGVAYMIKAL